MTKQLTPDWQQIASDLADSLADFAPFWAEETRGSSYRGAHNALAAYNEALGFDWRKFVLEQGGIDWREFMIERRCVIAMAELTAEQIALEVVGAWKPCIGQAGASQGGILPAAIFHDNNCCNGTGRVRVFSDDSGMRIWCKRHFADVHAAMGCPGYTATQDVDVIHKAIWSLWPESQISYDADSVALIPDGKWDPEPTVYEGATLYAAMHKALKAQGYQLTPSSLPA